MPMNLAFRKKSFSVDKLGVRESGVGELSINQQIRVLIRELYGSTHNLVIRGVRKIMCTLKSVLTGF